MNIIDTSSGSEILAVAKNGKKISIQNKLKLNASKTHEIFCDIFSLEFPLFSLSKPSKKSLKYLISDMRIMIAPNSEYGQTTMKDKEVWLYIFSKCMNMMKTRGVISHNLTFTYYDCLSFIRPNNANFNKTDHKRIDDALDRLKTTSIKLVGQYGTDEYNVDHFSYISEWKRRKKSSEDTATIQVTLSNFVVENFLLGGLSYELNPLYFSEATMLNRRLYEVGLRRAGTKKYSCSGEILYARLGSCQEYRKFHHRMRNYKSMAFLGYALAFDDRNDVFSLLRASDGSKKLRNITVAELKAAKLIKPNAKAATIIKSLGSEYYVTDLYPAQTEEMIDAQEYPTAEQIIAHDEAQKTNVNPENSVKKEKVLVDEVEDVKGSILAQLIAYGDQEYKFEEQSEIVDLPVSQVFKQFKVPISDLNTENIHNVILSDEDHRLAKWYNALMNANYRIVDGAGNRLPAVAIVIAYKQYCCDILGYDYADFA